MFTQTSPSPIELLNKLYILDASERERILRVIELTKDEDAQKQIVETLSDAVRQQDEWMGKIARSDLHFPEKMEKFLHERVSALKAETDSADAAALQSVASSLND